MRGSKPRQPARQRVIDPVANRARVRAWRKANPDRHRFQSVLDQHRRRGVPFSAEDRAYSRDVLLHDPCSYCGEPGKTIDHIDPVSLGGDSHWSNLAPACLACNSGKGPKPLLLYLATRRQP